MGGALVGGTEPVVEVLGDGTVVTVGSPRTRTAATTPITISTRAMIPPMINTLPRPFLGGGGAGTGWPGP